MARELHPKANGDAADSGAPATSATDGTSAAPAASGSEGATSAALDAKFARLQDALRQLDQVVVAFSAGVDSTFLLKVAVDALGADRVLAVTADSPSLARSELAETIALAEQIGAPHRVVETREIDRPEYRANPTNRCYFCKSTLYAELADYVVSEGFEAVLSGTNADDLGDFRPGLQAGQEYRVRTPVADVGLTKAEVRVLSARLGLPTFDKPASPCLASRIPYGQEVTPEKLRMIEEAEAFLRELGFRECRVRHHDVLARIEVPATDMSRFADGKLAEQIDARLREIGFSYVSLDLRGFRSGSLNEVVPLSVQIQHRGVT
jgi:uncharacterized protein